VNISDKVCCKIDDLIEFFHRNIEHETNTRWDRLEEPDMSDRRSELNMSHSLTSNLRSCYFYTTTLTDNALVSDTFVITTRTFIVLSWTENLLTEETTTLRTLSTVVDCF
jgi:hypothetical protein